MQEFMALYWTDRYNPSVTAPVEINITIESQYADGWAKYAEERMTEDPKGVLHPFKNDSNTVRIVFGEIGDGLDEPPSPNFAGDVLYTGASDWAYEYYNASAWPPGASADGKVTGNATRFKADNESGSINENNRAFALYNKSGQWLIYDNSTGGGKEWVDSDGNKVDPDNTEAIVKVESPDQTETWFRIKPPKEMKDDRVTPVCMVTNPGISPNTADHMTDYLDEEGEGCLKNMVGVDEDLVDPIQTSPDFNVTITDTRTPDGDPLKTDDNDPDIYPDEQIEVDVEIENEGDAAGETPLGVYVINESNWENGTLDRAYFAGGNSTSDLTLDHEAPDNDTTNTYNVDGERFMIGDEWVVFAATGDVSGIGDLDWTKDGSDNRTFNVTERPSEFEVEGIAPNGTLEEGQKTPIEVEVNETQGALSEPENQTVYLEADNVVVGQTEVRLDADEGPKTVEIDWTPRKGTAGDVNLTASTFDDSMNTTVNVDPAPVDSPAFDIEDAEVEDDDLVEGDTVEVDVKIKNHGNESGTSPVTLDVLENGTGDSELVDAVQPPELAPDGTRMVTLQWDTGAGDQGTYDLVAEVDGNTTTRTVEIDAPFRADPEFDITIDESASTLDVTEGEEISVTAEVAVQDASGLSDPITQDVTLENFDGGPVTATEVVLDGSNDYSTTVELVWNTTIGDSNPDIWDSISGTNDDDSITGDVTIAVGEDSTASDTAAATIAPKETEPRDPLDVVFVMDESGSMDDPACDGCDYSKAEAAINASQNAVGSLNATKDRAGVAFFDSEPWWWGDEDDYEFGSSIEQSLTNDMDAVNSSIDDHNPGGGTRSDFGLIRAEEILDDSDDPDREKVVVLLSDGANDGCKGDEEKLLNDDPADCDYPYSNRKSLNKTQDLANNDTTVYSVGYGNSDPDAGEVEIDPAFLQATADIGGGEYYNATNDDQLADAFADIFDDITEPDRPTFEVEFAGTDDPVEQGEVVEAQVEVTNTGSATGEGTVVLKDPRGNYVDSANRVIAPSDGPVTINMTWNTTGARTGSNRTLTAVTVDDSATTNVTVQAGDPGTDFRVVSVDDGNSNLETTVGGNIVVNATVENVGPEDGAQHVFLTDSDGFVKAVDRDVSIPSGESKQIDLVWATEPQDANGARTYYDLFVETEDGNQNAEPTNATVIDPDQIETDVLIDDVTVLNDDDSVSAGNDLEVNVTLTTEDDVVAADELVWLEVADEAGGTVAQPFRVTDVPKTGTKNVTLTWDTTNQLPGTYEFNASTNDAADGPYEVTVEAAETPLNVGIVNTDDPVTEGDKLEVVVDVENTDTGEAVEDTLLLKDTSSDTIVDVADNVNVSAGDTETITMTWNTRYGDGNDDNPATIRVEVANTDEDDEKDVQIDDVKNALDSPSLPEPSNPLDIDLEEIEIGT
jgi:hypothetical protein